MWEGNKKIAKGLDSKGFGKSAHKNSEGCVEVFDAHEYYGIARQGEGWENIPLKQRKEDESYSSSGSIVVECGYSSGSFETAKTCNIYVGMQSGNQWRGDRGQ